MKTYIGTKIIQAEPQTQKGEKFPNGDVAPDLEGYKVVYPDGYVSWSPKDVFETAYRELTSGEIKLIHS